MPDTGRVQHLKVFLLKDSVTDLADALVRPGEATPYALKSGLGFTGVIYIRRRRHRRVSWQEFVQSGTGEALGDLSTFANSAVVMVKAQRRTFAITFGYGWTMLRPGAYEADFGIRTALNSVKAGALRSIDTHTFDDFSRLARIQTSTASPVESFGIDIDRDLLQAVVGPASDATLGSVIAGREGTLALSCRAEFADLGTKCKQLLAQYKLASYKRNFGWVDQVHAVADQEQVNRLDEALERKLGEGTPATLHGSPPEPLEWEDVSGFTMPLLDGTEYSEVPLREHIEQRREKGGVTIAGLRRDRVSMRRASDDVLRPLWTAYKCIVCEMAIGPSLYMLAHGTWFEVNRQFASRVRTEVNRIAVAHLELPAAGRDETEGDYNLRAASGEGRVLLDRKNIKCRGAQSVMEACDLWTRRRQFVHVKSSSGGSKSFSHLFAQGHNSAQAFMSDDSFRASLRETVRAESAALARLVPLGPPNGQDFEVVFAVIGNYPNGLARGLPFFSQVTLMRISRELRTLGLRVGVISIERED